MTEIIDGIPQPVNVGDNYVKALFFETISSGTTSGTVAKPAGAGVDVSFVMDEWGADTDALVTKMVGGKPTYQSPVDSGGNTITTTFNTSGDFALSGTPVPAGDHAIIYVYKCKLKNFDADESIFETELTTGHDHSTLVNLNADDHLQYLLTNGARELTGEWGLGDVYGISEVPYLDFFLTDGTASQEGRLKWNSEDGTLEYGLPGGNVNLQVGQEQLVKCTNKTGFDIANGKSVYVSGAQGSRPTIALADASAGTGKVPLGVTTEPIADDDSGYVNVGGLVRDIDTSAIPAGGIAFLSDSSPGEFRATPPAAPNYTTVVGYCLFSSAESGILFVRVLSAPRLQSLSDVDHTGPSDKQFYRWNAGNSRFELADDSSIDISLIPTASIGTPTYGNLDDRLNLLGSAGRASGGEVTDAGSETVNVAAGTGFIKATDSDVAELLAFDWAASNGIAIPTDTVRYIGVIYGTPPVVEIRLSDVYDLDTEFVLAKVVNEGGTLHILNDPHWITDATTNIIERFEAIGHLVRDEKVGGLILTVPATRRIAVTTGVLWSRLNEFTISAFTSVGDAGTFEMYWKNSSGVWADNHLYQYSVGVAGHNDITQDALQDFQANRFGVIWAYAEADDDSISLLYPQTEHVTVAQAEAETAPSSLPVHIAENAILIGRIIFKGGTDVPIDVQTPWAIPLTGSAATDHGNLVGLADDDHPQYIKDSEFTQDSGILVGTGAGAFVEETGVTLRTSIGCDAAGELAALTPKNPPIDADKAIYRDSTDSDALVTSTWTQIKAFLKTYFDGLYSTLSHAGRHVDGNDDIQDATSLQKGLATSAQITALIAAISKLAGIATGADVTGDNAPQAHAASHTDGNDDIQSATNAQKGVATAAQITALEANVSKLAGIESGADVTGSHQAESLLTPDVRATNEDPSFYYAKGRGLYTEFKQRAAIGAPGSATYGFVTIGVPWNDATGGKVVQTYTEGENVSKRYSTDADNWGSWTTVEDGATLYPDAGEQAFLDADHSKLDGIEALADVTNITLLNNGIADALHRHSELVASDGSPDPALSVSASGLINLPVPAMFINFTDNSGAWKGIAFTNATGGYSGEIKYYPANTSSGLQINAIGASAQIRFSTAGTVRFTIQANGKVKLLNGTDINEFSTDTSLGGNSDDAVPTEKAVKAYADTKLGLTAKAADSSLLNNAVESVHESANSIVKRDSNGYIHNRYININADVQTSGLSHIAIQISTDGYIRWAQKAAVLSFLNVEDGATAGGGGGMPRGYIDGLITANYGADALHDITISVGACRDSGDDTDIVLAAALRKRIDAAWLAGSGNGGMDTGSVGASDWYHIFMIYHPASEITDAIFTTTFAGPTMPSGYTKKRRIGAVLTDGSSNIIAYSQVGNEFLWDDPPYDVAVTNQPNTAVSRTLSVPTGLQVIAVANIYYLYSNNTLFYVSPLDVNDEAPSQTAAPLAEFATNQNTRDQNRMFVRTNTASQIRGRSSHNNTTVRMATLGWIDPRGEND